MTTKTLKTETREDRVATMYRNEREWTVSGYVSGETNNGFVRDFNTKREAEQCFRRWLDSEAA